VAFTIPNNASAAYPPQAQIDKVDLDIVVAGCGGTGVSSGCAVTAQASPDMTVAVAAGNVVFAAVTQVAVTGGNVTIAAAHATLGRFDLIAVDNAGAKSRVAGTAASTPVFPAIPANSVILAAVYVPPNATTIQTNQITDKRCTVVYFAPAQAFTQWTRKTADEAGPNNTTLQSDDHLILSNLAAGIYQVECFLHYSRTSGTTGLLKVGWTCTDGSATFTWREGLATGGDAAQNAIGATANLQTSAAAKSGAWIQGKLTLTTTATLTMQWADSTGTDPITVYKGSSIRATFISA
jgi:hypothetical protein